MILFLTISSTPTVSNYTLHVEKATGIWEDVWNTICDVTVYDIDTSSTVAVGIMWANTSGGYIYI